jgi:hypothetical protein
VPQVLHEVLYDTDVYVPLAHVVQAVRPAGLYLDEGQAVRLAPLQ